MKLLLPFGTVAIRVERAWTGRIRQVSVLVVELGCSSWCPGAMFFVFGQIGSFLGRAPVAFVKFSTRPAT